MKRSILTLGLIGCLLMGSVSFATVDNVKVETEVVKEQVEKADVNIEIPVIKGLKNSEYEKELNSIIKTSAEKELEEFKKDVKELIELDVEWDSQMVIKYEVKSKSDILSIIVDNYIFTGGAHGQSKKDYYNIDLNENKLLKLGDLFVENSDYKTVINKEINTQIEKQILEEAKAYFEDNEGFVATKEEHDFYIDERGDLVITFQPYEITPWYMGSPEFKIPKAKIVKILKDVGDVKVEAKDIKNFDKMIINDKEIKLDNSIYNSKNNVTMIPLREVTEALGFKVTWDQKNWVAKTVKEELSGEVHMSPKGQNKYVINKDNCKLEEDPCLKNGTTFIPISFIRELLGNGVFINVDGVLNIRY